MPHVDAADDDVLPCCFFGGGEDGAIAPQAEQDIGRGEALIRKLADFIGMHALFFAFLMQLLQALHAGGRASRRQNAESDGGWHSDAAVGEGA